MNDDVTEWEKRRHEGPHEQPYLLVPNPYSEFPLSFTMPEWLIDAIIAQQRACRFVVDFVEIGGNGEGWTFDDVVNAARAALMFPTAAASAPSGRAPAPEGS